MLNKILWGVSVIALVLAISTSFNGGLLGGTTNYDFLALSDGISIGSTGTSISVVKTGTVNCSGALAGGTITASSTGSVDCAISGVVSGDTVILGRPAAMTDGWFYTGAYASTTSSGYIVAKLYNNSGASAIPPATATTSVPYLVIR